MALKGMTGFGRSEIVANWGRGYWETRSVNGRGLDVRLNLPNGFERIDQDIRSQVKSKFSRGNFQLALNIELSQSDSDPGLNRALLAKLARRSRMMTQSAGLAPSSLDGLLNVRGVMQNAGRSEFSLTDEMANDVLEGLSEALDRLMTARTEEGSALATILEAVIVELEQQSDIAEKAASEQPQVLRDRFQKRVSALLGDDGELTEERLAQEAAIFSAKADVREELDRLRAHLVSARDLIKQSEPVGRKLDFLCQELNREANTLCSKSALLSLTNAGLAMKAAIDQFKEQVQNVE